MANLLFKRGLLKNLPTTGVDGTIYVTTDEPGLYVGVGTEVKRIGDFQIYDTLKDLEDAYANGDAFSTHALYYVTTGNYLLKFTGSQFIHINDYSSLQASLDTLSSTVAGHTLSITNLTTKLDQEIKDREAGDTALNTTITNLKDGSTKTIKELEEAIATEKTARENADKSINENLASHTSKIGALESDMSQAKADIDKVEADLAQELLDRAAAVKKVADDLAAEITARSEGDATNTAALNTLSGRVGTLESEMDDAQKRLSNLENNNVTTADLNALKARVETAEGEIDTLQSELSTLKGTVTSNFTTLNTKIEDETKRATAAEEANANAISGHETRLTNAEKAITDEVARAKAAEKANADNISTNAAAIATNKTAIGQEVTDRKSEITRVEGLISTEKSRAEAAESALDKKIDDEIARAKEAESGNNTLISKNTLAITSIKSQLEGIDATAGAVKKYIDDAEDRLEELITSQIDAANAMTFLGTLDTPAAGIPSTPTPNGGHTYVVAVDGTYSGVACYAGDLLVYDEGQSKWIQVKTGYASSQVPGLFTKANSGGAKVYLLKTEGVEGNGGVTITGNDNIVVTSTSTTGVSVTMVWDEF